MLGNSWLVDVKLKLTFFAIENKTLSLSKSGMHKERCENLAKTNKIAKDYHELTAIYNDVGTYNEQNINQISGGPKAQNPVIKFDENVLFFARL